MNQQFEENGFLVVKNFITKKRAKDLSRKFIQYCKENPSECVSDTQIPNTPAKYNYIPFLELLCEKTPEVSKLLGEIVLPTYSYSRVYKNGDVLKRHTDRDACEISLTINLNSDQKWEIFLEDLTGKIQSIILNPGDALMYSGCAVPHWREEYVGNLYSQVFLHYVKSEGSKNHCYFDNGEESYEDIKKWIYVIDDVISHELCENIINEYSNSNEWEDAIIGSGLDKKIRNCQTINLSVNSTIEKNYLKRKKIDNDIFHAISNVLSLLSNRYKNMNISTDTGYSLLKYEEGGFYRQHTDSSTNNFRTISCSLILNDDYDGGEFCFFNRKLKYELKKGSAIIFPSNFMYPHEILEVKKSTRYSIITWFN